MAEPTTSASPPLQAHAGAAPLRALVHMLLPPAAVLFLLALVLGLGAASARWVLTTEAGSAWLLQRLPVLQAQGWRGALLGERWHAEQLRLSWSGGATGLVIDGLDVEGLRWRWRPDASAWVGIEAGLLHARKITFSSSPGARRPISMPQHVAPPLRLRLAQARIEELAIDALGPVRGVVVTGLVLDPRPGAEHRIESLALEGWGVTVAGALRLGNAAPLALVADATLRPTADGDAPRWAAALHAGGTLERLQLDATLRGRPGPRAQAAPTLDLRAMLQPLQPWVLAGLSLQTQALDLSALSPRAPATRLSGRAELAGGADGTPLTATVALQNALPGRWNELRLPVRRLAFQARGVARQPDRVALTRFELDLGDAANGAGLWTGTALWQGHELTLDTQLAALRPQHIDGRAAAATLSGPLAATLLGLPSPDTIAAASAAPVAAPSVRLKLDLQGRLDASPQPVQVQFEGSVADDRLELTRVHAQAGNASADIAATVVRASQGAWKVQSHGSVLNFDPQPWWPGHVGAGGREGPHRLSGQWQFELRLPGGANRPPPLALVQRLAGSGSLHLQDSLLAGVPLAADVTLASEPSTTPAGATLHAELRLGGNLIVVDGRGDPAGSGDADRWNMTLNAGALAALGPLTRLAPALQGWAPRQGSASALLAVEGRWPALRFKGSAGVAQLQAGPLALAQGTVAWSLDSHGQAPLALQIDVAGLQLGKQRADHLRAELRGTLADHHIELSGALPVVPPAVVAQLLGIEVQSGTRAKLTAQGGWQADPGGGSRWRAHIERLAVGSWDGGAGDAASASDWAAAQDLRAEVQFGGDGQIVALQADAGRLRLSDVATLHWDAARIVLQGDRPQVQLRADIEPFTLAPVLARAQPGMGWQGDLRMAARVDIRAAEHLDADLVFERRDGDLNASSGDDVQLLGLTEFRLALTAHDGVWDFTQAFRGRSLGEIAGRVRVHTTPERRWPQAEAPIEGSLQARVADIGIWSAWVPPGWRLSGELRTTAAIGGRWSAPQYSGEVSGSGLSVRNLLQGVNFRDGQVLVRLAGDTAEVEHFTLKGGDGGLEVTGGATLGAAPQARLHVKAERFRVLGRVDRQLIVSGNAELLLQTEKSRLEGRFTIDEGLFDLSRSNAPTLDDDVVVHRAGDRPDAQADAVAPKARSDFSLAVDLDLGDKLRLRGRGLDTTLVGSLRLSTPGGRLAVNGTIDTESGTYAAYGQKLSLERGSVAFSGAPDNPRLDVLALRPNIDYRVGVSITGNLLTPRVRLYSDPDMSDSDKLSWLVLGRAPDGLGRNDTAFLQRAAVALMAGEGGAPTDALLKTLGIDDVSLHQGESEVRQTVVSIGKQLTRRWYLSYERGVNATTGNWQLTYRIAQRFTLRLQSGLDNAADVIWTWRFGEPPADASVRKSIVVPP